MGFKLFGLMMEKTVRHINLLPYLSKVKQICCQCGHRVHTCTVHSLCVLSQKVGVCVCVFICFSVFNVNYTTAPPTAGGVTRACAVGALLLSPSPCPAAVSCL